MVHSKYHHLSQISLFVSILNSLDPLNGDFFQIGHNVGMPNVICFTLPSNGRCVVQVPSLNAQTKCPGLQIVVLLQLNKVPFLTVKVLVKLRVFLRPRQKQPYFKTVAYGGILWITKSALLQSYTFSHFHHGTILFSFSPDEVDLSLTQGNTEKTFPSQVKHQEVLAIY